MRSWAASATALVVYVALSLVFFGSIASWSGRYVAVGVADPELFMWFLNWWPFALLHGLNPFWTHFVWYPRGFDTVWATSVPTLALAAAPLTLLAGATASYNFLTLLAPVLNAWCCFFLVRCITRDAKASFIAGLLYGFSSYELGQMLGHLNLDFTFLVPLVVLLVVKRVREEISPTAFILLLTLALVLELGISEEVFASLCVLGALVWTVFLAFAHADKRRIFWRLATEIMGAGLFATVMASPFLYYLIIGMDRVPSAINSAANFSADPLNFILPTQVTWFGNSVFAGVTARILGGASEEGGYLGVIVILILGLYYWEARAHRDARSLLLSIAVLALCSLGPWLHLDGVRTSIPLPWLFFTHLPLIRSALPIRFTMYVSLAAAISVGCWIAAGRGGTKPVRLVLGMAAYLCLLPNPQLFKWSDMPADRLFHDPNWSRVVPRGANVVILPFAQNGPDMSWQLDARMQFTQSGGYVGYPPLDEWASPIVRDFFTGRTESHFTHDLLTYCRTHHVSDIIIAPGTPQALADAIRKIGWTTVRIDGDDIVSIPPPETP